jgi:6-pyruvoyl-tetrahydropterin synthase
MGSDLGEGGMLVDFSLLKTAMNKVLSVLDHSDLN